MNSSYPIRQPGEDTQVIFFPFLPRLVEFSKAGKRCLTHCFLVKTDNC